MEWQNVIVSDNNILSGKPIVKNTRISVELIMHLLSIGWSETEILENYPNLTKESILACKIISKN